MRLLTILGILASATFAAASDFLGIFLQGQRIGYMHSVVSTLPDGKVSTLVTTHIGAKVLGQGMQMKIVSSSIRKGAILESQKFTIDSGGRGQNIEATFGAKEIAVKRVVDGKTETRTVLIPEGALVLDDPTIGLLGKGAPEPGTKIEFYILDPMTLTLVKNSAEYLGKSDFSYDNVAGKGDKLKIVDPRATTEIWLDPNGEMLFSTGPLGMQLRPITREEAVGSEGYLPEVDIAAASRITPDKPIENPSTIKSMTLKVSGANLPRLKGDYYQKVETDAGGNTLITIAPPRHSGKATTIADAGKQKPEFIKPALNVPAEDAEMKKLAAEVLAGEKDAYNASQKLSAYVFRVMRPNASIGVLRDAREILRTKEGVCRDYATLAATLMRAAGIPTKMVTGAVYSSDGFYYHAWVETWVGDQWISFDPTLGGGLSDATHIKFAEGDTEEAFITFTLDGAKIEVKEIVR